MIRLCGYGEDESLIMRDLQNLVIHSSSCDYFENYTNCIALRKNSSIPPPYMCLYTEEGNRIELSCLRRGIKRTNLFLTKVPKYIDVNNLNFTRIKKRCIYLGGFGSHWGHALTEFLARAWICNLENYNKYYFLYYGNLSKKVLSLLKYLGISNSQLIEVADDCVIDEVIVPYPSIINRGEIFTTHAETFMTIAKNVMSDFPVSEVSRPLYLSRTRLPQSAKLIKGETKIENYLIRKGANVEFFENLSMEEQVYLINRHKIIISPTGSALHNVLFSLQSKHILCLANNFINLNQYMIDKIKDNCTTWFYCTEVDQSSSKPDIRKDLIIKDVENTIGFIDSFLANV